MERLINYYGVRDDEDVVLATAVVMAVKRTTILKKLSDLPQRANLNEIKALINPHSRAWAADWVAENAQAFKLPVSANLLEERQVNNVGYGYGDDRAYALTVVAREAVVQYKSDRDIAGYLQALLMEAKHGRDWFKFTSQWRYGR